MKLRKKIEEELHQEWTKNFKAFEDAARKERKKSVDWELVKKRCNPKQIEAIKLFVEFRLYEAAASIAEMDLYDFIELLISLGISRG
ncbi:MAG: hypothetical protein HWN65_19960 [Candidatus Helarchaeota archaeon]|nr:hypothetical protein [Candidatus Helarchaeota archaeon]